MPCKLLQNDQAQLCKFCDTADRLEATAMRLYKLLVGAFILHGIYLMATLVLISSTWCSGVC